MDSGILFTVKLAIYRDNELLRDGYLFNTYVDVNDCLNISSDDEEIDIDTMEEMAIKYAIDKFFDQGNVLRQGEAIEVFGVSY